MKWLVVILVIFLILVLVTFVRYRKQALAAWQVWRMFRQMRQMGKPQEPSPKKTKESLKETPLVRCEKCGTWISPESALKLRGEKYYCSSKCMERAAKLQSLVD